MQAYDLYQDIAQRTQGDVYVGVVGPVRTGKSTFIRRLMEKMIIPAIENAHIRARAQDDLPQSGSGRTVMTTKPAFIPSEAVDIALPSDNHVRLRFVDSVGYMVRAHWVQRKAKRCEWFERRGQTKKCRSSARLNWVHKRLLLNIRPSVWL